MSTDDIQAKLKIAQDAVKNVDPSLREKAFEVILSKLLEEGQKGIHRKKTKTESVRTVESKGLLPDRIGELIDAGFFKEPKAVQEIKTELSIRGYHHSDAAIGMALLSLIRRKTLRRIFETKEGKKQYLYTNP